MLVFPYAPLIFRYFCRQMLMVDRLREIYGNDNKTAIALGIGDNYVLRWRRNGFIPETHALAIEALRAVFEGEVLTAYDVLLEARDARAYRIGERTQALREHKGWPCGGTINQ